ncbi:MAG: AMIN domain-containing protein [Candidatus Aminicenantes bacterium]|nr:AMIN domain-containing protein [Candidatus Aminicenantes bacterium]
MGNKKYRFLTIQFLFFISLVSFSFPRDYDGPGQMGLLEEIVITRTPPTLEVRILCNFYTSHRKLILDHPNQIVIDLLNIEDILARRRFEINDFGIQAIRAGMFKTNIARVVFDLKADIPPYKIETIERGLKVSFWPIEAPEAEKEKIVPEEKPAVKIEEKAVKEEEKQPETVSMSELSTKLETEIKESLEKSDEQPKETKKVLDELTEALDEIQVEKTRERRQFIRIEAMGGHFQPREKILKDTYEGGLIYGLGLNVGVWKFAELWIAEKYFHKRHLDEAGEERRINLIPLEAGLKFRLNKGTVNPYFGFGVSYFLYKEILLAEEIKDRKIGYIGLAGVFFKIKGGLVFDVHAQYSYCRVSTGEDKLNVGGLHIGAGVGFEY